MKNDVVITPKPIFYRRSMNDSSSDGKISFIRFLSINVKGNLAEKNSQLGAKITRRYRLS